MDSPRLATTTVKPKNKQRKLVFDAHNLSTMVIVRLPTQTAIDITPKCIS